MHGYNSTMILLSTCKVGTCCIHSDPCSGTCLTGMVMFSGRQLNLLWQIWVHVQCISSSSTVLIEYYVIISDPKDVYQVFSTYFSSIGESIGKPNNIKDSESIEFVIHVTAPMGWNHLCYTLMVAVTFYDILIQLQNHFYTIFDPNVSAYRMKYGCQNVLLTITLQKRAIRLINNASYNQLIMVILIHYTKIVVS